jgi:hypothetical protein
LSIQNNTLNRVGLAANVGDLRTYELVEQGMCTTASDGRTCLVTAIAEQDYRAVRCYVLLFLAWAISYFVFNVPGV